MSVEMTLSRETLCFERLALAREEQVSVEGEATLPGSMRDAVTVLSVQAQAYLEDARATAGGMTLRGHVSFQALYTQGDLTRIRAMETTCDFEHSIDAPELQPDMRVNASVAVQETEGTAASGRMTLRALLDLQIEAFETTRQALVTDAAGDADALGGDPRAQRARDPDSVGVLTGSYVRMQRVAFCRTAPLGEEKTLVREEFDLPARLEVGDVLSATGEAAVAELTGGAGRVGVSGTVEVRVLHRPQEAGNPLVMTSHELPFELSIDTQIHAQAEAIDVMADSMADDKRRTLRVEAEVRVRLSGCVQEEKELLEDLYSVSGDALIPQKERFDVHAFEESSDVRESIRLPIALAKDAPPIGTALAAFAQPTITAATPAGKRLDAEGVMAVTLIYLPMDSDIPMAIHTREPFAMTFPIETTEDAQVQARVIEATPGPATSDRAEVRCVVGLHVVKHGVRPLDAVIDVAQQPAARQERGFVLVWPAKGESRWETAKRLRVAEEELHPAGKGAMLAFRK
mgnify:CR=1 FL=1